MSISELEQLRREVHARALSISCGLDEPRISDVILVSIIKEAEYSYNEAICHRSQNKEDGQTEL